MSNANATKASDIPSSVPPPAVPRGFQGKGSRTRREQNLRKYGTPLPILLPSSPLHPQTTALGGRGVIDPITVKDEPSWLTGLGLLRKVIVPSIVGVLDLSTESVWVEGEDMEVLFNRGFFGKGTLSRSDPSWRKRRIELVRGGDALVAEQVREKRREERKQFKIDRAAAMLDAAKKAEAVLTTGQLPPDVAASGEGTPIGHEGVDNDVEAETGPFARPASPTESTVSHAATDYTGILPDGTKLTAQTFLVRPERPEGAANRNRGKKAFRRRPPPPAQPPTDGAAAPGEQPARPPPPAPAPEEDDDDELALEVVDEMEHLQLSYEEAWFLSALGVLKIRAPATPENGSDVDEVILPQSQILPRLLTPVDAMAPVTPAALYPDDPFLVNYAAYHHYRSLGWCVRHGIKFCVDWLLYRRGPVFSHSAFSILLVPVYKEEADQSHSPYGKTDWYMEKMSWKWINTVMRVNNLAQKTVILTYVTIPPISSFPESVRLHGGGLDPQKLDMRSLMTKYAVQEVSLTRFSAARRRD